jgi:methyl-accepting chemotaxis protein
MNKSPINFLGGAIAGAIMGRRGKKKTSRALKKIDKRLSSIESKIDTATSEEQSAVPEIDASMEAVDEIASSVSGDGGSIPGASMDGGVEPVPGAVDALEEDSFATVGDSGINMNGSALARLKKNCGTYKMKKNK